MRNPATDGTACKFAQACPEIFRSINLYVAFPLKSCGVHKGLPARPLTTDHFHVLRLFLASADTVHADNELFAT